MAKNFQDIGNEIMEEVDVYLEDKKKFEDCLNDTKLDKNSEEYKNLFFMFDCKIWEELRGRIYEIVKEIPFC